MKKHLIIVFALLLCASIAPSFVFLAPVAHAQSCADGDAEDSEGNPCPNIAGTGGQGATTNVNTPTRPSSFIPLTTIPGLTDAQTLNNGNTISTFLNNLYKFLIGLGAAIAVIEIIWGGLEIATQDSIGKHTDGRARIQQAILGLVLLLSPVIVFTIINPNILALSYTLDPLTIQSVSTVPGGGTSGAPVVSTGDDGVTTSVTGTNFQIATFSGSDADKINAIATAWVTTCSSGGGIGTIKKLSACASANVNGGTRTCTNASSAIGQCGHYSPMTYNFINTATYTVRSGYGLAGGSLDLRPLQGNDGTNVTSFVNSCSGGRVCFPTPESQTRINPAQRQNIKNITCPPGINENLSGGASGRCYQSGLLCAQQGASQCAANVNLIR